MLLFPLARGMVLGLAIAAPVGPIGVLCIRRTLANGRLTGFVSGSGAATADAIYAAIAAFGLTALSDALIEYRTELGLVGGLFLCYLGFRTFRAVPVFSDPPGSAAARSLLGAYLSTLGLTLTNPATIISFTVIFAGLGLIDEDIDRLAAGQLVLGVFLGSLIWWLFLSGAVGLLRGRLTPHLRWVNRGSGAILAGFGLVALVGV